MRHSLLSDKDSSAGKGKQVRKKNRFIWVLLLVAALLGCDGKNESKMENTDMISHRIGRLVVDLPAEFSTDGSTTAIIIPRDNNALASKMEIHVVSSGTSKKQFEDAVVSRQAKLLKAGAEDENALKETIKRPDGSTLFRILKIGEAYASEVNQLVGDTYVRITAVSYRGTFEKVEAALHHFASSLVPVSSGKAADFCLGTISFSGANQDESAQFYYRSTRRPDLRIEVSLDTFQPDADKPLLTRMSDDTSLLKVFDIKHRTLRKHELTVAGMRAQEWLGVARLGSKEGTEYNFVLETLRPTPGPFAPYVQVQLMSGQYDAAGVKQPNSLDDESALQLWDPIVKSIRMGGSAGK